MAKPVVTVISVVLLAIGVIGFVNDPILGTFEVDTVHNLIHLLSGLVGLVMASRGSARAFAIGFGLIYGVITVLGFTMHSGDAMATTKLLGLVEINHADNYLHLALTAVLLLVGFTTPVVGGLPVTPGSRR